jgi:hypothetical protein
VDEAHGSSAAEDAHDSVDEVNRSSAVEPPNLPPTERGKPFGRYRLIELLGRGGMDQTAGILSATAPLCGGSAGKLRRPHS